MGFKTLEAVDSQVLAPERRLACAVLASLYRDAALVEWGPGEVGYWREDALSALRPGNTALRHWCRVAGVDEHRFRARTLSVARRTVFTGSAVKGPAAFGEAI